MNGIILISLGKKMGGERLSLTAFDEVREGTKVQPGLRS